MRSIRPAPGGPRPRRLIFAGGITKKENLVREMDMVAERHIRNHQQFELIISSLREGIAVTEIARYFAVEQWLTVSEKTFVEYLHKFRRMCYAEISSQDPEAMSQGIQRYVRGHMPDLDVDVELNRAIRFQQLRVGIGHKNERDLGMPIEQVGRDMIGLGKLIELKLKRKGLLSVTKAIADGSASANTRDELTKVVRDQEDQDKLYAMANELVSRNRASD